MAELKTTRNDDDVDAFLNSVENKKRRRDAFVVQDLDIVDQGVLS